MRRLALRASGSSVVALLSLVLVLGHGPDAMAAWQAQGVGAAAGAAATMPNGNTPSGSATGSSVSVTWAPATFADGVAVAGYVVSRYNAATGLAATVGPGCSGVVTTPSCTELSVSPGNWVYTDTPVQMSWTGGQSAQSAPVSVLPG